jgi:hypothetical protein
MIEDATVDDLDAQLSLSEEGDTEEEREMAEEQEENKEKRRLWPVKVLRSRAH